MARGGLGRLTAALEREVGAALFAAGNLIQVEAQISLTEGAVSGKNHVPSTAPNPPNQDTGVLGNNIETLHLEPLLVAVSSNAPYAAYLEYGTSRMSARPYMGPAAGKSRKEVGKIVADAVKRAAKI
jgi:HK97 gp10 family phage protein